MTKTDRTSLDYARPREPRPATSESPRERTPAVTWLAVAGDAMVVLGVVAWGAVLTASRGVASWFFAVLLVVPLLTAARGLWREFRGRGRERRRLALYAVLAVVLLIWGVARVVWQMVIAE